MRSPTRRGLFGGIAAVAATPAVALPPPLHADAELLRLGEQLTLAWAQEKAAWAAAEGENNDDGPLTGNAFDMVDETGAIVNQIEGTPATTLAGVLVKMQAIAWCCDGEFMTIEDLVDSTQPTTNLLLVASLLRDLTAMGGSA